MPLKPGVAASRILVEVQLLIRTKKLGPALILMATVSLAYAADWEHQPFTGWDRGEAVKVLTDSPWAHRQRARLTWLKKEERKFSYQDVPGTTPGTPHSGLGPLGGIGAGKSKFPDEADLIFRWASALPVRQATAVFRIKDEKLAASQLNSLIPQPEADYVLEVFGIPVELAHMGAEALEAFAVDSVTVKTASGRTIKATSAKVTLQPETLSLKVHFPRTPALELSDKEIECLGDLQVLSFHVKFKLSAMQYQNHLEL